MVATVSAFLTVGSSKRKPTLGGDLRFYTADESEAWLTGQNRSKPDTVEGCLHLRVSYPRESYRILYIARWVATELTYRRPTLLWVT